MAAGSWTTKAPMMTPRWNLAAGVATDAAGRQRLYAIGGFDPNFGGAVSSVEAYDFGTNSWAERAPLPVALYNANGVGNIGGKLYLSGGVVEDPWDWSSGLVNHLYEYDPNRNTWTRKADMPKRTAAGVTGVINGKLYVLAGTCDDCASTVVSRLFRYDPVTNSWSSLPSAPAAHVSGAGGVINGKFYVAGGRNRNGRATNRLDVYDPVTNSWSTLAPMPTARSGSAAAVLAGRLYVIGSNNVEPGERQGFTEAYSPTTNTWTIKTPMPGAGRGDLAAGRITHNGKGHILAVGGTDVESSGAGDANQAYTE